MNILLTGGTGLIGSRVAEELHLLGHEITELRRYAAGRVLRHVPWETVPYDLRGGGEIPKRHYGIVLHLAALASNAIANVNPTEAFDIIATGTQRLIQDVRRTGSDPWFILASSSEVYASPGERRALNPYAAAKIAAEEAVGASGFAYTIMRPFNTYGRGLVGTPVSVIDKWVVSMVWSSRAAPILIGNNMGVLRDFLWREDHVRGYLHLISAELSGNNIYELGTGEVVSLAEVLSLIEASAKRRGLYVGTQYEEGYRRPGDVPVLQAAPERMLPGWGDPLPLSEGIEVCIDEWERRIGRDRGQPAAEAARST